ncbi:hypothetical protein THAOC_12432, partial [Thalassiosira oceanica]
RALDRSGGGERSEPRGSNVAEQQEACPTRRRQPNQRIQTDEKKRIRDTAKDPSRSEGKQSSDVSNPRSYYSSHYSSTRLAADEEDGKEEADRNAVEDMDVDLAASQLESVDLSEQDQTKKSVSFCKLQHTRGPVVVGKAHGEGTLEWTNGEVYKGGFKDGYRTGKGEVTTSRGNVFVGHFHEGYMTGEGKVTYTDGGSFEGRFHRGQKVYGKWTFRGQYMVDYVGHFHEGHPTEGKVTYSDGNSYDGTFHEGWRVEGKLTYDDGRVYEGRFRGPYSTLLHHSSSVVGLLTFTSDDPRRNFKGDILALEERENDTLPRRGKMTLKDGTSYDGMWVAGWFVRGLLRWREFTGRYPLAYDDKIGKKEWHPLFGLVGSVLWNELEGEIDTLGKLSPVHWHHMTSCDSDCDEGYSDRKERSEDKEMREEDARSDNNPLDFSPLPPSD